MVEARHEHRHKRWTSKPVPEVNRNSHPNIASYSMYSIVVYYIDLSIATIVSPNVHRKMLPVHDWGHFSEVITYGISENFCRLRKSELPN